MYRVGNDFADRYGVAPKRMLAHRGKKPVGVLLPRKRA